MEEKTLEKQITAATLAVLKNSHTTPEQGLAAWLTSFLNTAATVGDVLGQNPKEFVLSLLEQAQTQVKEQFK